MKEAFNKNRFSLTAIILYSTVLPLFAILTEYGITEKMYMFPAREALVWPEIVVVGIFILSIIGIFKDRDKWLPISLLVFLILLVAPYLVLIIKDYVNDSFGVGNISGIMRIGFYKPQFYLPIVFLPFYFIGHSLKNTHINKDKNRNKNETPRLIRNTKYLFTATFLVYFVGFLTTIIQFGSNNFEFGLYLAAIFILIFVILSIVGLVLSIISKAKYDTLGKLILGNLFFILLALGSFYFLLLASLSGG